MTDTQPPAPLNSEEELENILTDLWCKVDAEDVQEGLIDVGAIDDAKQAIKALLATQCVEAEQRGYEKAKREYEAGGSQAVTLSEVA